MYFVGIHGPFKSGKDTLASWLAQELGGWIQVHIRHFAAELRAAIETISNRQILAKNTWSEAEKAAKIPAGINWNLKLVFKSMPEAERLKWERQILPSMASRGESIGKLLQDIGLLGRTVEGEDIWVSRFEKTLPKLEEGSKCVVLIPDFRFPNEGDWLMRRNASLIKVDPGQRMLKDSTGRDTGHISETALRNFTGWNLVLDNSGTLEQYRERSKQALYYVNAQLSGIYLNLYELVQLLASRLKELQANKQPLYKVPSTVHDLCEVARQECKLGLLADYMIERRILNKPVRTLVKYLVLPGEY